MLGVSGGKVATGGGTDISGRIKGEIQASIGDLNKVILDPFAAWELSWIQELCRTKLPSPCFFPRIRINSDNTRSSHEASSIDKAETDATTTKDGDSGAPDSLLFDDGAPCCGYATTKKASFLQRSSGVDSDDRYVGNDCVLRERRGSHL